MQVIDLVQGSKEWKEARRWGRNASEAPVVMGTSPYMSINELILEKRFGADPVDKNLQKLFDSGHEIEAWARPKIEQKYSLDLAPLCAKDDEGYLSCSFDGCDIKKSIIWECKLMNQNKLNYVRNRKLPPWDLHQVVQQLYISEAKLCIYTLCSREKIALIMYTYDRAAAHFPELLVGWKRFDKRLEESRKNV